MERIGRRSGREASRLRSTVRCLQGLQGRAMAKAQRVLEEWHLVLRRMLDADQNLAAGHFRVVEKVATTRQPARSDQRNTVARIAPSIVTSKIGTRNAQPDTVAMLPTFIGQSVEV